MIAKKQIQRFSHFLHLIYSEVVKANFRYFRVKCWVKNPSSRLEKLSPCRRRKKCHFKLSFTISSSADFSFNNDFISSAHNELSKKEIASPSITSSNAAPVYLLSEYIIEH